MVEYSWCYILLGKEGALEYHRKQMETDMTYRRTGPFTGYEEAFDNAACDTRTPWLPQPPVADSEASETRGYDLNAQATAAHTASKVEATLAVRDQRYGGFENNAGIAQDLKDVFHGTSNWAFLGDSQREALEMIASKIGRMLSGDPNYIDNWHDIAGYATLIEQRLNKRSMK